MNRYEIQVPVTFKIGRFRLTAEQYRRRKHVVRLLDEHALLVEPITEISFKRGEVIETDLEMPKTLGAQVRALTEESAAPAAVPAAEPPAAESADSTEADEPQNGKRRGGRRPSA